jgi:hypothetical protein
MDPPLLMLRSSLGASNSSFLGFSIDALPSSSKAVAQYL